MIGVVVRCNPDHITLIEVIGGKTLDANLLNIDDDPTGEDLLLHYTTTWEGLHPLLKEAGWPEIKCNMGEIGRQIKFLLYNTVTAKIPD